MKVLIVGGAAQGKGERASLGFGHGILTDGADAPPEEALEAPALANLHRLVWRLIQAGEDPETRILEALDRREHWLFTCDEVGCGVVPLNPIVRDWREAVGRLCCALAARADVVERVSCGIAQRLKG